MWIRGKTPQNTGDPTISQTAARILTQSLMLYPKLTLLVMLQHSFDLNILHLGMEMVPEHMLYYPKFELCAWLKPIIFSYIFGLWNRWERNWSSWFFLGFFWLWLVLPHSQSCMCTNIIHSCRIQQPPPHTNTNCSSVKGRFLLAQKRQICVLFPVLYSIGTLTHPEGCQVFLKRHWGRTLTHNLWTT